MSFNSLLTVDKSVSSDSSEYGSCKTRKGKI